MEGTEEDHPPVDVATIISAKRAEHGQGGIFLSDALSVFAEARSEQLAAGASVTPAWYPAHGCLADVSETVLWCSASEAPSPGPGSRVITLSAATWAELTAAPGVDSEKNPISALQEAADAIAAADSSPAAPLFTLGRLNLLGMGLCPLPSDVGGGVIVLAAAVSPDTSSGSGLLVSSMSITMPSSDGSEGAEAGEPEVSEAIAPLLAGASGSTVRVLAENTEAGWVAPVSLARSDEAAAAASAGSVLVEAIGDVMPLAAPEGGNLSAEPDASTGAVLFVSSVPVSGDDAGAGAAESGSGEAAVLLTREDVWPSAVRAQQQALLFTGGVVRLVATAEDATAVLRAAGLSITSLDVGVAGQFQDGADAAESAHPLHRVKLCAVTSDGGVMGLDADTDSQAQPQAWGAAADAVVDSGSLIALTGKTLQLASFVEAMEGHDAPITGVCLVAGASAEEIAAAAPEGFTPITDGACGGNLAAAAAMCSAPPDQQSLPVPAVVMLCVSRSTGESEDEPAAAVVDIGVLVRSSDSEFEASAPQGYTSQTVGMHVQIGAADEELEAGESAASSEEAPAESSASEGDADASAAGAAESKSAGDDGASIGITITLIWTTDPAAVLSTRISAADAMGHHDMAADAWDASVTGETNDHGLRSATDESAHGRMPPLLDTAGSLAEADDVGVGAGAVSGAGDGLDGDVFGLADHEQARMEAEAAAEATAALQAERSDLEARLREAEAEREAFEEDSRLLHRQALLYFLEKNDGSSRAGAMVGASTADKEERYEELLSELRSAAQQLALAEESFAVKGGRLNTRFKEQSARLDAVREKLAAFQKEVCDKACDAVTGRRVPKATVRQWAMDAAKLQEVLSGARQEQEVDRLRLSSLQRSMKAKEDVGEGLSAIDFEQLKIENATVHEKIEDRQEELRKLRAKMTTTVQVLTHVREKLQFVQAEADALHAKDAAVKAEVASQRAALAGSKRQRERQRALIEKRRTARGFAHSDALAIDFESRKTECAAMRQQLEDLRRRYTSLNKRTKQSTAMVERIKREAEALGVAEVVSMALS